MGYSPAGRRRVVGSLFAVGLGFAMPAEGAIGGPDGFGYTWADANDGGPLYNYEFSPLAGRLAPFTDDGTRQVALPFAFEFYGQSYANVQIHSNGGLTFAGVDFLPATHSCPTASYADRVIFALWMDLDPTDTLDGAGEIYAATVGNEPQRHFIVEWFDMPRYDGGGSVSFEVKLFEADGHIELHYQDLDFSGTDFDDGKKAVIGLARPEGSLTFSCDAPAVTGGQAIGFYPPACEDGDEDGHCAEVDCDDADPDRHPGAPEVCNGVDDDCSGAPTAGEVDADDDGFMLCENDCDDTDAAVYPEDRDGDGWSPCLGDCDDDDPLVSDVDNDGDGLSGCAGDCDDTTALLSLADLDGDGRTSCVDDCDDDAPAVFAGAPELCDGEDNDCDATIDENPNCSGDDDDDDATPDDAIAYGCFVRCDAGGPGGPGGSALLLSGLTLAALRRRVRGSKGPS